MTNIFKTGLPARRAEGRTGQIFGKSFPRTVLCLVLILALTAAWAVPVFAETVYPKPTDYIADDAAILSESTVREIKEKNDTLISEVKAVIAVCTVKTTSGVDIGKYARSVYTEWQLPAGVLILIASEDNAFYLVQSSSIGDKITNEELEGIRDREIEEDFAAGNIDRAVRKAVSQLSILMLKELKTEEAGEGAAAGTAAANSQTAGTTAAQTGTSEESGSLKDKISHLIVTVLKVVLALVLLFVIVFVILFVAAMFNDDAAAFMQKTFFRKNAARQRIAAEDYYDDRLYNDGRQPQNRPRPANQQNRPVQQGQYQQGRQNPYRAPQGRNQQYPGQYAGQQVPAQYQQNQQIQQNQYSGQYANPYGGQYNGQQVQQVQRRQYANQQYAAQPRQPQQYANQYGFPVQQQPQTQAQQQAQRTRSAQPYSAANDPGVIRQRQAQSQNGDPSATQTYTIPGRGGY